MLWLKVNSQNECNGAAVGRAFCRTHSPAMSAFISHPEFSVLDPTVHFSGLAAKVDYNSILFLVFYDVGFKYTSWWTAREIGVYTNVLFNTEKRSKGNAMGQTQVYLVFKNREMDIADKLLAPVLSDF